MDTRRAVRRAVTMLGVPALLAVSGCVGAAGEVPERPEVPPTSARPAVWPPSPKPSPQRNRVEPREHAGPRDRWILDALEDGGPTGCPRPSMSNLVVLDSDGEGRGHAYAVWLADDVEVCVAALVRRRDGRLDEHSTLVGIDDLATGTPLHYVFEENGAAYVTAFLGVEGGIALKGDETGRYHPARSRTVQLGGGRVVTFAVARFVGEYLGRPVQHAEFCPVRDGSECHPV